MSNMEEREGEREGASVLRIAMEDDRANFLPTPLSLHLMRYPPPSSRRWMVSA